MNSSITHRTSKQNQTEILFDDNLDNLIAYVQTGRNLSRKFQGNLQTWSDLILLLKRILLNRSVRLTKWL